MYRASRVLRTLINACVETRGYQFIKCPLDRCFINPVNCHKARGQTCTQEVSVIYEHEKHNKLVNLRFYFTISATDHDGFIHEDNEPLRILIARGIINEEEIREPRTIPGELFADIE